MRDERRVYVLPFALAERIRAFQAEHGIASEVEAARRLLTAGLDATDSAERIGQRLRDVVYQTGDLRRAAKDVLMLHPLVRRMRFTEMPERCLQFELRDGSSGEIKEGSNHGS